MATFSFDIISDYDKAEMNNVFMQTEKEMTGRYDFKGTPAAIEWIGDKAGLRIIGENEWQCDAVIDIVGIEIVLCRRADSGYQYGACGNARSFVRHFVLYTVS